MRKYYALIFAIVLLLLVFGCSQKETPAAPIEKGEAVFGEFTTTDMAGDPVNEQVFSDHKLTMVNIWATFCNPCVEEMPGLAQLQSECGDDFQIIGIVVDVADMNGNVLTDKKADAAFIIERTGADYLHLLPSKSLNQAYLNTVQAVPETIFVDENGCQVGERYLGARSKAQWKQIVDALLEDME